MIDWRPLEGLGYKSAQQSVKTNAGQTTNFASNYNNGVSRLRFQTSSFVPGQGPFQNNLKAKEFGSNDFGGVLVGLNQGGALKLPYAGLGEFLLNPAKFQFPPDFLDAWSNFFATQIFAAQKGFQFPQPFAGS